MAKQRRDSNPNGTNSKNKNENEKNKKNKKAFSKKLLSGPGNVAMKAKIPKENPFENIWSRKKFDIVGKKRKGEEKRTGLARSRAIDKRKNTLLKEYEQSGKSSVFLDKRIGEQNDSLGEFDKAILRSQRERQVKFAKKSKFNLSDGEEDDDVFHGGHPFSGRDDFDEEFSPDEDADETTDRQTLLKHVNGRSLHNPLGSDIAAGEQNKHKSEKEIMKEVMQKSKFYKALGKEAKLENLELLDQLDKDFTLVQCKGVLSLTQPSKMSASRDREGKESSRVFTQNDEVTASRKESYTQEQPDTYDKLVKAMALDMRARPSDRTKTPEEIAQEEKEQLERLEEERQKRMLGNEESSDEDGTDHEDVNAKSTKQLRSISGDDLGDSFDSDEKSSNKKGWADEILERPADNVDDDDDGSSEDSESDEEASAEEGSENNDEPGKTISLKDWEQSDDDEFNTDLEGEEEEDEEEGDDEEEDDDDDDDDGEEDSDGKLKGKGMQKSKAILAQKIENMKTDSSSVGKTKTDGKLAYSQDESLPFTIDAPNSLAELCSLLDNRSNSEVIEAISRIRKCNAIRLAAENRKKMQVFYGILLQYFAILANKKPLNFKLLNLLVKPLMEMSVDTPYFAAICARERIHRTRAQFCEDMKYPEKSCWPSVKTLFLLKLWSMIFPCSDFRHVVMTPAILLMCEYLMRCPITSGRDVAIGSFLCSMVLSVIKQSLKFCPEAIIFLRTLLVSALETTSRPIQHSQFYYLSELKMLKPWLKLQACVSEMQPLDFFTVMNMPENAPFFSSDIFRASVLMSVIETLRGFVNTYERYDSFPEIFLPISNLLKEIARDDSIRGTLQENIRDVSEFIEKKAGEHHMLRVPLQMRMQKPVPIKLLNPKFEENFVKGRDYDPDRERAEKKKLLKQIKREAKGAARELRKDNHFLFEVKEKDRALFEEERNEKYGRARAFLQEQEHAFRSGQLGKGRKRRR